MTDLTEMEQRVLSELEEFGEENIFAMLNTIIEPTGDPQVADIYFPDRRQLVEFLAAMRELTGARLHRDPGR